MKKITSMLCALTMAFSLIAAPAKTTQTHRLHPQQAMTVKSDKAQMERLLTHAKTEKERAERMYKFKQTLKKQQTKAPNTSRRTKQDVQAISVERYNSSILYGTSLLIGLHNDTEDIHFFYQFPLAAGAHSIELGRTYTLAEMEAEGCEWDEYDSDEQLIMHYYTAATFVMTKGTGYDVHIAATATDSLGNQFSLTYDETPLVPTGDSVTVTISRPLTGCEYNDQEHYWLVRAQDNTYSVQLQYYSTDESSPAGSFGAADIELSATYLSYPTGELDEYQEPIYNEVYAKDGSILVTQDSGRTNVNASILAEDGVRYLITLFYALPEADSQETFLANNLHVDTWAFEAWGEILITASTEDGKSISLDFYGDQEAGIPGTYNINESSSNGGSVTVDGEQYNIYSGSVTISLANDAYSVSGTILCWNNVEYTLNLNEPEVVVSEKTFASANMIIDVYPTDQFFEVWGFDTAGNYMLLTVNSATVAGDYTLAVDTTYTYAEIDGNDYILRSADIHVTYEDGLATISGTLHMLNADSKYDEINLTLNLQAGPYQPSVRDVTISEIYHFNSANDQVCYMLTSDDGQQMFTFMMYVPLWNEDVELAHTYTQNEMNPEGTLGQNKAEREYIVYQTASFTKTAITTDSINIVVTVLDTRGNTWNLIYEGLDTPIEGLYVTLGQANAYHHADGGIEYELVDEDNTLSCHLVIAVEEGMDDVELDSIYRSANGGINLELSYLSVQKVEYKIVEAELCKETEGDEVWVSANVTDERGFQYMLRYHDDGFILTGDTIRMHYTAEVSANYSDEYATWNIYAEGDQYIVKFALSCDQESLVGTHVDDVETWSSRVEVLLDAAENNWLYVGLHSVMYLTVSETGNGYALEALAIGEDGNVYDIAVNTIQDALENIVVTPKAVKRIVNGVLIIERDGASYNAQGAQIR